MVDKTEHTTKDVRLSIFTVSQIMKYKFVYLIKTPLTYFLKFIFAQIDTKRRIEIACILTHPKQNLKLRSV